MILNKKFKNKKVYVYIKVWSEMGGDEKEKLWEKKRKEIEET